MLSGSQLKALATSRGFELVSKTTGFWLISLKTRLPEVNIGRQGLSFTADEAEEMLDGLSATDDKDGR
jgi:hypothetical protein